MHHKIIYFVAFHVTIENGYNKQETSLGNFQSDIESLIDELNPKLNIMSR